jgi:hypothetical protein
LSRRGVTLSVAALAALLGQVPPAKSDAAFARSIAASALEVVAGAIVTPAASIAQQFIRRLLLLRLLAAAASVLLLIALIGGVAYAVTRPAPPGTASPKIKVGFIVSVYNATTDNKMHIPNGFGTLGIALQDFDSPQVERFAILDPGTQIPTMLRRYFAPDHAVDGADPAALAKLDVIVACLVPNLRDDVMAAMKQAVSGGVGLLNYGAPGCDHPGMSDIVNEIAGMKRLGCFWSTAGCDCTIAGDHPLIAELTTLKVRTVHLEPQLTGSMGVVFEGGQALLEAPGATNRHPIDPPPPPEMLFQPLYISHLGDGRIICFQWGSHQPELVALTDGKFYIRCLEWLAKRPVR